MLHLIPEVRYFLIVVQRRANYLDTMCADRLRCLTAPRVFDLEIENEWKTAVRIT